MFTRTSAGCSCLFPPYCKELGSLHKRVRSLLTQSKAWITKGLVRNTSDLVIPSLSVLLIIRSKQDFGSSTIDHVSENNQKKNAQPAPKKPCPAKPFRSREIIAQPLSQYSTSSLPPEERNLSQEQQSPLPPPLASRGNYLTEGALQGTRHSFSGTNWVQLGAKWETGSTNSG